MRTFLKWAGIALAGLLGIVMVAALFGYFSSESRINSAYAIEPQELALPTDAADVAEGRRLLAIRGCADCHGSDLGGELLIDDPGLGTVYAANLTTGQGSAILDYGPGDWERAIRHGIGTDGRSLIAMPTGDYAMMSDEDIGRMVAYLETVPAVDREPVANRFGPLGRALLVAGQLPFLSAETVDHTVSAPRSVTPEVSVAYGQYVATTCTGCHGPDLGGGPMPGAGPDDTPAANLTPSGNLANWSYDQFAETLSTGVTPEGKVLDPSVMPWPITTEMTDIEREALWVYLNSLQPAPAAN